MIEIKREFSQRELLWFGPLFALFAGIVGLILLQRFQLSGSAYVLWAAAGALIVAYYLLPPIRKPTYQAWLYAVFPVGWVVSHILLALIFYLLVTPIGLLMRVVGYDPMARGRDPSAKTYWILRDPDIDDQRYFRQS